VADYIKSTNFAVKDTLTTGNPAKIVKGTEIDTEFNAIASAIASKLDANSPTLTGTPLAPTASTATNNTQIATTAYVVNRITNDTVSALALKANIASPTFTGTPAAPTAASGTNTTQLATTAFVTDAISTERTTERVATATLTNKTISVDNNTISGIASSSFVLSNGSGNIDGSAAQKVIPSGVVVGTTDTQTLTNKTINASQLVDASITAAKLNGAQSGSAPIYGARAWVNFNGTSTVSIRASGNVTSITDNGAGDYTINFTTAMSDANYSISGIAHNPGVGPGFIQGPASTSANQASASFRFNTIDNTFGAVDQAFVQVAVFR